MLNKIKTAFVLETKKSEWVQDLLMLATMLLKLLLILFLPAVCVYHLYSTPLRVTDVLLYVTPVAGCVALLALFGSWYRDAPFFVMMGAVTLDIGKSLLDSLIRGVFILIVLFFGYQYGNYMFANDMTIAEKTGFFVGATLGFLITMRIIDAFSFEDEPPLFGVDEDES